VDYDTERDDRQQGFDEFVERWRDDFSSAWETLPEDTRKNLGRAINLLPGDMKGWRALIDRAIEHLRWVAGTKRTVAIIGPVNAGKSTLYNQFIRSRGDRARVSAVPGTTRYLQEADAGIFMVIDTPGADAPGVVGEEEKERALQAAKAADILLLIFDASHGIRSPEQDLYEQVKGLGKPTIVVLNKMDLIKHERPMVIGKAAATLGIRSDQLIPVSAKKGNGLEKLLLSIAKTEPGIVAALGAALPEYRWRLAQAAIARAASTAAAIAVTPLPFLDFFPLIGVQSALVLSIARIFAYRITLSRARELVVTFGLAMLGRTLFYELSKIGGLPGWILAAAVAAGTTTAMGYAAAVWFEKGERISRETMERISRAVTSTVIERLKSFGKRRPKKITLRERIQNSIEEVPELKGPFDDTAASGSQSKRDPIVLD
jgi:small GTP-binding protein